MKLWRIICVATAAEASFAAAVLGLLGLGGAFDGWLDVVNQFAPFWLFVALLGGLGVLALAPPGRSRPWLLGLASLGGVIGLAMVGPDMLASIGDGFRGATKPPLLKLVTFNVWSENPDPERTLAVILAAHPDVAAIQEEAGSFGAERAELRKALPFRTTCPGDSDIALYSVQAPIAQGCGPAVAGPPPAGFDSPIWIRVRARDGREVTVVTTHFIWPFPPRARQAELVALADFLRTLPQTNLVLVGDFNMAPWSFAMRRQDALLRPLTRRTHAIFTWPARIGRLRWKFPTPVLAIDHVYAGPGFRSTPVRRLPLTGSDHYGLAAWFYG